jgi:PTS system nitrogen regulatory IIA component
MNRLASILSPAQVLAQVEVTSKKRAFEEAGLLFENLHGLSRALVADSLFSRERLGSTVWVMAWPFPMAASRV